MCFSPCVKGWLRCCLKGRKASCKHVGLSICCTRYRNHIATLPWLLLLPVAVAAAPLVQAAHADRLVARGVGVVSREAPAFRKADTDPVHYTAQGISGLIREVSRVESHESIATIIILSAEYSQRRDGSLLGQRYICRNKCLIEGAMQGG